MPKINTFNSVKQGFIHLFNHFEDNDFMWSESGDREIRKLIEFGTPFESTPIININITLMDAANDANMRYHLNAENITNKDFEIVFNTWHDTKFARVWVTWTAMGQEYDPTMWTHL